MRKFEKCAICQQEFNLSKLVTGEFLNEGIAEIIHAEYPNWTTQSLICKKDLAHFRAEYFRQAIEEDLGVITQFERDVLHSIKEQDILAKNLNVQLADKLSYGDRLADKVVLFGGSWKFIIFFCLLIFGWIVVNTVVLVKGAFDPYPFIFLNLVLSCLAAMQAPIIMMAQNRQAIQDRLNAEMDYKVNLKAELEIRHMKSKIDLLASHQWRRLLEIQELQREIREDLAQLKQ